MGRVWLKDEGELSTVGMIESSAVVALHRRQKFFDPYRDARC